MTTPPRWKQGGCCSRHARSRVFALACVLSLPPEPAAVHSDAQRVGDEAIPCLPTFTSPTLDARKRRLAKQATRPRTRTPYEPACMHQDISHALARGQNVVPHPPPGAPCISFCSHHDPPASAHGHTCSCEHARAVVISLAPCPRSLFFLVIRRAQLARPPRANVRSLGARSAACERRPCTPARTARGPPGGY